MLDHESLAELPGAAAPRPAAPGAGGGGGEPLDFNKLLGAAEWCAHASIAAIARTAGVSRAVAKKLRKDARFLMLQRQVAFARAALARVGRA